ncbi:hypothetical protein NDU88_009891 [Pleurodeles waltl]|uniref:Uncharacterized protein n=1 Tax=Pleurodeles waltl TaxID=8319 RepID=A0AAV7PTD3_PLEWA|nr:hypothetical protein NDU88_009891 [Pleurodeles waltl]
MWEADGAAALTTGEHGGQTSTGKYFEYSGRRLFYERAAGTVSRHEPVRLGDQHPFPHPETDDTGASYPVVGTSRDSAPESSSAAEPHQVTDAQESQGTGVSESPSIGGY